jgi:hypothetical protein
MRYSRLRLPTVTFTEVGAGSRSRKFSTETALPPVRTVTDSSAARYCRGLGGEVRIRPYSAAALGIAVASVVIDTIGKKKYGFNQISLAVPTNLIDDCVIGIPLAAAMSGVNPWTFRQWIKQGRGQPLVRLALRTLTAPLIVLLGREAGATLLKIDGLIMPSLIELCAPHLVHALVVGATERHGRSKPNVEIAKIFESAYKFLGIELGAATL